MKRFILLTSLMLFGFIQITKSQTIAQALEQLLLDTEKLSELKNILTDMYKDYQILDKGYTDIKNIVQGNFNLHQIFLDGLLAVSPAVKNYERIDAIINAELSVISEYKTAYSSFVFRYH